MMRIVLFGLLLIAAPLTDAHAKECYEGTATINQRDSGSNCTTQEKGYYNSSAGPKTHDGCTAAKADARQKLIARIQQSCVPYVQTNAPCKVININRCT
jgi:hypothetical protein